VDARLHDLTIFATIALLFVLSLNVLTVGVGRRRQLEERLDDAYAEIAALRAGLADATRPPTQFARMRMREAAVDRFARLRLAAPGRSRKPDAAARVHDLSR